MELTDAVKIDIEDQSIRSIETVQLLWSQTYNTDGKPDWSHILPFYDNTILFRDSIQQLQGMDDFKAMTERLTKRSSDLKMNLTHSLLQDNIVFIEWEMTIGFKKYPNSIMYGASRLTLNQAGKIIEQRDYYDLWGDIFDNIPRFGKAYRRFMKKKFG
ncbi:nuclear transport factor 2 family protein [Carboxylicivirga sp. M1479]|uniref:nuclear transport factor 2 family protein n=1 Tax=Carboxylicivirga sp. M1479 TaxID=2594476 RepID=UPI0011779BE1|nr:nuclear transport factor 2 family protein [Carboxylicivirga sp. M1479]TRX71326.1 nuclear transport factor 2 family protein [Carboxylicivirga sp. M1479]